MPCLINTADPDAQPAACGEPCVGVVWWVGEDYADAVCTTHIVLWVDSPHRVELGWVA